MSALDGFYSTWNKARETFGAGTPDDGSQFDGSARLRQMKAGVEAAAPDARWQGTASEAYAAANKKHADIYEKLADLDQKMAAEIKNAANIVTAGRESLDRTRDWVSSLAASVPNSEAGKKMLLSIISKGMGDISEVIQSSTVGMTESKGRIEALKAGYDELKTQQFAPAGGDENGKEDTQMLGDQ